LAARATRQGFHSMQHAQITLDSSVLEIELNIQAY